MSKFRDEVARALGKRATLRLRDSDGGFRDIVGVFQSETELINRRGEVISFNPDEIVLMRVIPVFNRRDNNAGQLSMYDTMSRTTKEITHRDGVVTMYCCGPTVYRDAHVGNLRTFLLADLIARTITMTGLELRFIQNITDVGHMADDFQEAGAEDDKMLAEAKRTNSDPFEIAKKYEAKFHDDLARLNVIPANLYPKASENMTEMISAIEELIAKNSAYVGSDGS
ncbi:MAG: cysteine--tRNA ligase, partial [Candidatus Planktophila sp.]